MSICKGCDTLVIWRNKDKHTLWNHFETTVSWPTQKSLTTQNWIATHRQRNVGLDQITRSLSVVMALFGRSALSGLKYGSNSAHGLDIPSIAGAKTKCHSSCKWQSALMSTHFGVMVTFWRSPRPLRYWPSWVIHLIKNEIRFCRELNALVHNWVNVLQRRNSENEYFTRLA